MIKSSLRGFLKILVILIIAKKPIYGYKIMEEVERSTLGLWKPSPGALYPILREFEKKGYLRSLRTHEGGREKIYYDVTEKGKNLAKLIDEKLDKFRSIILNSVKEKISLIKEMPYEDLLTIKRRLESWRDTLNDVINIIEAELSKRLHHNI